MREYLTGRSPTVALIVWLVCAACGFFFWRSGIETCLLDQPVPRVVPVVEAVTVIGSALCGALMASRLPVVDQLSVRPMSRYAAQTTTITIALFATIPLIPLVWVRLLSDWFPQGTFVDTSDEVVPPVEVYTASLAGTLATVCAFLLLCRCCA